MTRRGSDDARWQRITLERDGRVAWVTLARPDRLNALDPLMLEELLAALSKLRRDTTVTVIVVTGAGRAFCAGVDLHTPFFMEGVGDESAFAGLRLLDEQHELISALWGMPQLTVAAVQGDAVGGGGFGLAMACDLRYAARQARFWMVPGALNVVQDFGLTWTLQRAIGPARTLELAMTGRVVTAEEGLAWGLLQGCEPSRQALLASVRSLTNRAAGIEPDAARLLKHVVRHGAGAPLADQLRLEAITNGLAFQSGEFQQAKRAFLLGRTSKE